MVLLIVICAAALAVVVIPVLLVVALSRIAARADAELDRLVAQRIEDPRVAIRRQSYAGLDRAAADVSRHPSIALPASRMVAGAQRLRLSSCTSRRPHVRSNLPRAR